MTTRSLHSIRPLGRTAGAPLARPWNRRESSHHPVERGLVLRRL